MRTFILSILISLCLAGFLIAASNQLTPTDSVIQSMIIGNWIIDRSTQTASVKGNIQFSSDGTFYLQFVLNKSNSTQGYISKGTWKIEDGFIVETITKSNTNKPTLIITRDKVLNIDENKYTYLTEKGDIVINARKK